MLPKHSYSGNFTKMTMVIVYILFVLGAFIGAALVVWAAIWDMQMGSPIDSTMFVAYAAYLGAPIATAIGFYAWKSKAENLLKIEAEHHKVREKDVVSALQKAMEPIVSNSIINAGACENLAEQVTDAIESLSTDIKESDNILNTIANMGGNEY